MIAEVRLWGRTIGAVSTENGGDYAAFQYDPAFAASGIELSPLVMPLSERVYTFPALPRGARRTASDPSSAFATPAAGAWGRWRTSISTRPGPMPMSRR